VGADGKSWGDAVFNRMMLEPRMRARAENMSRPRLMLARLPRFGGAGVVVIAPSSDFNARLCLRHVI
jgi:hypothetical protein